MMTIATPRAHLLPLDEQPDDAALARIPILGSRLSQVRGICEEYGIQQLELFGSAATGQSRPDSDFDFVVFYPQGYDFGYFAVRFTELERALANELDRPVDLIMGRAISRPGFMAAVSENRLVVYVLSGR